MNKMIIAREEAKKIRNKMIKTEIEILLGKYLCTPE